MLVPFGRRGPMPRPSLFSFSRPGSLWLTVLRLCRCSAAAESRSAGPAPLGVRFLDSGASARRAGLQLGPVRPIAFPRSAWTIRHVIPALAGMVLKEPECVILARLVAW